MAAMNFDESMMIDVDELGGTRVDWGGWLVECEVDEDCDRVH